MARKQRKTKWQHPAGTATYYAWRNMRDRCNNPKNDSYKHYGERGITVCSRWDSYDLFVDDMGEKPEGTTLERLDTDKGYAPDNCAWKTMRENLNNRRNTIFVAEEPITVLAERIDVKVCTLRARLKRGLPVDRVIATGSLRTKEPAPHGTRSRYDHGCRCDACRAYNTARHRAYLDSKRTSAPKYYVYPDGSFYSADETTADELIQSGHSDDYILTPLPLDKDGDPYIPDDFWDSPPCS